MIKESGEGNELYLNEIWKRKDIKRRTDVMLNLDNVKTI